MTFKDPEKLREWRRNYYQTHKEQYKASMKKYEEKNKGKVRNIRNESKRKNTLIMRLKILRHYSHDTMTCSCCGETEVKFLTIDHINGGGNKEYKKHNHDKKAQYVAIIKNNFPPIYDVLCMNCNWAKGQYGECPHQTNKKIKTTNSPSGN